MGSAAKMSLGLAVENTSRENFCPTSQPHLAEVRGREASWADWLMTGEETGPGPTARG